MLIRSFGLFWERDEVVWRPGSGTSFRLLGMRGKLRSSRRIADFRSQIGIYVLYGDYGAHYVGLTRKRGLGMRLADHLHDTGWKRFSWFGFREVLRGCGANGMARMRDAPSMKGINIHEAIGDIEALLIRVVGTNYAQMRFSSAEQWTQIPRDAGTN